MGSTSARLNLKRLSVQRSGEDAGNHFALFVLGKMDMERRALPVRRKRSRQMQLFEAVRVSDATEREPFARVLEFDRQRWCFGLHRLPKYNGGCSVHRNISQRSTFIRADRRSVPDGPPSPAPGNRSPNSSTLKALNQIHRRTDTTPSELFSFSFVTQRSRSFVAPTLG